MATSRPTYIPRGEDWAQKLGLQDDHQSVRVIAFRVVLRQNALPCIIARCHGLSVGWWGAVRGPQWWAVRWDGIQVQSTAELACAAARLGSIFGLAAISGMACASHGVAAVD